MNNNLQWDEAIHAVQSAQSVMIVSHISPDGDAIGSLLGMRNALVEMGKNVTAVLDDEVPPFLCFLSDADSIRHEIESGEWDLLIVTDCSDTERTGKLGEYGLAHSQQVINLDHHPTNILFGDIHLVMPNAVSASEIVFHLLERMQFTMTREVAMPLLTGLVTDTLGFRTSNVTAETLSIAHALIESGASLTEITERTLDSKTYEVVELWKHIIPSVQLDGQVISAVVTLSDAKKAGLDDTTDGGLVSFLSKVDEAMVSVVFKEKVNNQVEISLRSKPGYDVGTTAFELGGGGHTQASGATIDGTLEEVQALVMTRLHEVTKQGQYNIV